MGTNVERYRHSESVLWRSLGVDVREVTARFGVARTALRVQEVGTGPPVLFIHGGSASGTNWAQLVPHLRVQLPDRRLLLVDRPGCGLSATVATEDGIGGFNRFADDFVANALDALDLEQADVVATSMGGLIAIRSALAHPERTRTLVQLAYCPGAEVQRVPRSMRIAALPGVAAATTLIPANRPAVRAILKQLGLGDAIRDGRVSDVAIEWFRSLLRDTLTMRNELAATPELFHWRRGINPDVRLDEQSLRTLATPTLFIWSTNDPIGDADVARAFTAQIPGVRLELLDDPSHAPSITQPSECADLIAAHITAHHSSA
ncbi:MAG: alpha/beta hydrolase [Actinomycetota bacterium]